MSRLERYLLGALLLAVAAGAVVAIHESRGRAAALAQAKAQEGRILAAEQREAEAKTSEIAAKQAADQALGVVARLQAQLALHPTPPAAQPVPPDASADLVLAGFRELGLRPQLLGAPVAPDLALGLTLPDSRVTLQWGRDALRVPPLTARLQALEALTQAQDGATSALQRRADAADQATAAADARADAQALRAANLQRAVDLNPVRAWAVGFLVGLDTTGQRRTGAYVSKSWGPLQAQVVVLGNAAAIGGGFRF